MARNDLTQGRERGACAIAHAAVEDVATVRRRSAIAAASRIDSTRLTALAMPWPAMSKAVPWSGEVRTKEGRPYTVFTPFKNAVLARLGEAGVPGVKVVRLANADHYVFLSNEADVLRAIEGFVDGLKTEAPARQRLTAAGPLPW